MPKKKSIKKKPSKKKSSKKKKAVYTKSFCWSQDCTNEADPDYGGQCSGCAWQGAW